MTQSGLPPGDIERIAAFLDRRLPEEERREFLDRLDSDEALYEVFVETVRYREEAAREESNVVEHPAARDWTRWMGPAAIAAMLALVVAGPILFGDGVNSPDFAVALVRGETLESSLGEGWYEQRWSEFRGPEPTGPEMEAAFRAGVRALELEVALRLERLEEANQLTYDLGRELAKIDLLYRATRFDEVRDRLDQGLGDEALRLFLQIDSDIQTGLAGAASGYGFGKWTETGRLAAKSTNRALLRTRSFREGLKDARQKEWGPKIDEELESLAAQLDRRTTPLDLEKLEGAFAGIINSH